MFFRRGFTLIELLVVISIVTLLSSVVLASLNSAREKARIGAGRQFEANAEHIAADQAAGMWDFNECTGGVGSITADRSGNGNNGTLVGNAAYVTATPSNTGCAISFDGSGDYVNVSDSQTLNPSGDMSLGGWIYINALPAEGSYSGMIFKLVGGVGNVRNGYNLHIFTSSGQTAAGVYWGIDNLYDTLSTNTKLATGTWYHILATRSGTQAKLYVNGQLDKTSTLSSSTFNISNVNLTLGRSWGGGDLNGRLDNIRVYNKSLTASEVGKLYAQEKSRHVAYEVK